MHRAESNDPHNYDMVLDSHSLGLDIAAEIIVHAVVVGRPSGMTIGPMLRGPSDRGTTRSEPMIPAPEHWAEWPPSRPAPRRPCTPTAAGFPHDGGEIRIRREYSER